MARDSKVTRVGIAVNDAGTVTSTVGRTRKGKEPLTRVRHMYASGHTKVARDARFHRGLEMANAFYFKQRIEWLIPLEELKDDEEYQFKVTSDLTDADEFPHFVLIKHRQESLTDIVVCDQALEMGITTYNDSSGEGSVAKRKYINEQIVVAIDAELKRRRHEGESNG